MPEENKTNKYIKFIVIPLFVIIFIVNWVSSNITIFFNIFEKWDKIKYQKKYQKVYNDTTLNQFFLAGFMNDKKCSLKMFQISADKILIVGGNNGCLNRYFEIFNTQNGNFQKSKLPAKYDWERNSLLLNNNEILLNDSFIYNFQNNSFNNIFGDKKDFSKDKYSSSFQYSNNEILIKEDDKTYIYNTDTKELKNISVKFPNLGLVNFIRMNDNNVLLYGLKYPKFSTTDIYLWNTKQNSFKKIKTKKPLSSNTTFVKLNNKEVIIFGNSYPDRNTEQLTYKINIETGKNIELPNSLTSRKSAPVAILLSNGKIFLIGGETSETKGSMVAELFDPKTNKYNHLATYSSLYIPARYNCKPSVIELNNKNILICGGIYESHVSDKCIILKMEKESDKTN